MPRYEHWLFRTRPSAWPKAIACVSVSVTWSKRTPKARRLYPTLHQWAIEMLVRADGKYSVVRQAAGTDVRGFWETIRTALLHARGLYVITAGFRTVATVLDLWGMLERDDVYPIGKDHREATSARRKRSNMGVGCAILEDPPIVLQLRMQGVQWKLMIVDSGNYGLPSVGDSCTSALSAHELAAWVVNASTAMAKLGRCGWQSTAGALAMHLFKTEYLNEPVLSHTHPLGTSLERAGLFGGRCECFQLGRIAGPVHAYDFRSMYGWCMANGDVPCRLGRVYTSVALPTLFDLLASRWVMAEVQLETDQPFWPYRVKHNTYGYGSERYARTISHKHLHSGQVIYPIGRFSTVLCGDELAHAMLAGAIKAARATAVYDTAPLLRHYAESVYRQRCIADTAGNELLAGFWKRILNNLPGKFAQVERAWVDAIGAEAAFEWGEWYTGDGFGAVTRWRSIAGFIQREEKGGFSHGTVPAISAAITSAGRRRLLSAILAAGSENVYYCDTDGIIVSDCGKVSLQEHGWIRQGEWGWLQHVCTADGCEIRGTKDYTIGRISKRAGASRGHKGEGGTCSAGMYQPWVGMSMRKRQRPDAWVQLHSYARKSGRYDELRAPGGRVKPVEVMEW